MYGVFHTKTNCRIMMVSRNVQGCITIRIYCITTRLPLWVPTTTMCHYVPLCVCYLYYTTSTIPLHYYYTTTTLPLCVFILLLSFRADRPHIRRSHRRSICTYKIFYRSTHNSTYIKYTRREIPQRSSVSIVYTHIVCIHLVCMYV